MHGFLAGGCLLLLPAHLINWTTLLNIPLQ